MSRTNNSPAGVLFHQHHQSLHHDRPRSAGDHADSCCGIFGAMIGLLRRALERGIGGLYASNLNETVESKQREARLVESTLKHF